MKIIVKQGSIINEAVDAIINPANTYGFMGGGVAKALKDVGGRIIEEEAIHKCPTPVGDACITSAGDLPAGYIIHAPGMHEPAERTDAVKIKDALTAALEVAEREGYRKIAVPGMGTGVGHVSFMESARVMMEVIKNFHFYHVQEIILKDIEKEMIESWKRFL